MKLPSRKSSGGNGGGDTKSRGISWNPLMKMTAERNADYAICELQVPAYGLEAGSKVAVTLKERPAPKPGEKGRPELKHFRSGLKIGSSPKIGDELLIIAERSYIEKQNGVAKTIEGHPVVLANWIKAVVHDLKDQGPTHYATGFVNVGPITTSKNKDGEDYARQIRSVFMTDGANGPEGFIYTSPEDFAEKAKMWLEEIGTNGEITVRVANNDLILGAENPDGGAEMMTKTLRLYWNRDANPPRQMTAEESIEFFLDGAPTNSDGTDNEHYQVWRGLVEASADPEASNITFDAIVHRSAPTGKSTLEGLQGKRSRQSDEEIDTFNMKSGRFTDKVFIQGTAVFRHQPDLEDPSIVRLIATDTFPLDRFGPNYLVSELPGGRPPEVQAVLDQRAAARGEKRYEENLAARNGNKPKQEGDSPEAGQDNEAPANGLSMS